MFVYRKRISQNSKRPFLYFNDKLDPIGQQTYPTCVFTNDIKNAQIMDDPNVPDYLPDFESIEV